MVILMTIIISYFLYTNLETDSDIFDGPLERKDSVLGLDMTRDKRAVCIKKQTLRTQKFMDQSQVRRRHKTYLIIGLEINWKI